jgi:hypothetical protein
MRDTRTIALALMARIQVCVIFLCLRRSKTPSADEHNGVIGLRSAFFVPTSTALAAGASYAPDH